MTANNVPMVRKTILHKIEKLLRDSGWSVQSADSVDFSPIGIAIREVPLKTGVADYLLFLKGFPVGLVIAGETDGDVLSFSKYSEFLAVASPTEEEHLRFVYLCTGNDTFFTDLRHPHPPARRIFTVHSPGTLYRWYPEIDTLSGRFRAEELFEYAKKYRVKVVDETELKPEKHQVTIVELPRKQDSREKDVSVTVNLPERESVVKKTEDEKTPVNVTVNITNPEKPASPEERRAPPKEGKTYPRKRKKRVYISEPSVFLPKEKPKQSDFAPKKKKAKRKTPSKPKKRARKTRIIVKKRVAPKRKPNRRFPIGIYGVFGTDKVKNVSGEERQVSGGPGAYSALGAFFFGRVSVAGSVGSEYVEPEEFRGIEKSSLGKVKERASAVTSWKHSKSASVALAPAIRLNAAEVVPELTRRFSKQSQLVFLGSGSPEAQSEFLSKSLRKKPRAIVLQTASQWLARKRGLVQSIASKATAILLTEKEAKRLSGERNLARAVERISGFGPKIVVVKQQAEGGALVYSEGKRFFAPAYPVKNAIDPSGAWEVFGGAFAGYLASKGKFDFETAKKASLWGEAISSFKKEGYGLLRLASLERKEAARRVEELKKSASV